MIVCNSIVPKKIKKIFKKTLDKLKKLCYNKGVNKRKGVKKMKTEREKKIEIVSEMVSYGYALFGESVEYFVDRFSVLPTETFTEWLDNFKKQKGVA